MLKDTFFTSFSKVVSRDDTLVLAVSGGVDSMVMLSLILDIHQRERIVVAHFDHSLRGEESDGDRLLVERFCQEKDVLFQMKKMDIAALAQKEKGSIESVARKYRYEFLSDIAEKYSAKCILTAHHQDDRIETALFNLIRGAKLGGVHALGQLSVVSCQLSDTDQNTFSHHQPPVTSHQPPLSIFRPLLDIPKSEIVEYAEENHIPYREDSSNTDTDYQRNHLRLSVLPLFQEVNPEYRRAITSFIDYTEELKGHIDAEVRVFLGEDRSFSVKAFEEKSLFFQKEVIRHLYEKANHGTIGLSERNIEEILRYITTAEGGTEKVLGNLRLTKRNHQISVSQKG